MEAAARQCNICPKQPTFSDISHLLTHVSSRAHLSHYFKLQVRSHQDAEAEEQLEKFDRWYKANNLAKLLSDRMSKETCKKKARSRGTSQRANYPRQRGSNRKETSKTTQTPPEVLFPNCLDPHLSLEPYEPRVNGSWVKVDSDSPCSAFLETPAQPNDFDPTLRLDVNYPEPPPMTLDYKFDECKSERDTDSRKDTSSTTRTQLSRLPSQTSGRKLSYSSFGQGSASVDGNDDDASHDAEAADKERPEEIIRLKGAYWPGMDLFDSATEQMKRMRNQKKDERVLKMMEKTSQCTTPTEMVFSPTGILRKERLISGEPNETSPLKGEICPLPKQPSNRSKRCLLSRVDPNVGPRKRQDRKHSEDSACNQQYALRSRDNRITQAVYESVPHCSLHRDLLEEEDDIKLDLSALDRESDSRLTVFYEEQEDDFKLTTLGDFDRKPDRRLKIFRDEQAPNGSPNDDLHSGIGLNLRGRMAQPYLFKRESRELDAFLSRDPVHKSLHPPGSDIGRQMGKENIEPLSNSPTRIDQNDAWSPFSGLHLPTSENLSQGLFGRLDEDEIDGHHIFGLRSNPLVTSFPLLSGHDDILCTPKTAREQEAKPALRAISFDGSISDIDQDDLDRLYLNDDDY